MHNKINITPYINIISRCIIDLKVKGKTLKFIDEHLGYYLLVLKQDTKSINHQEHNLINWTTITLRSSFPQRIPLKEWRN